MIFLLFLITWLLIINEGQKTRRRIMAKIDDSVTALEQEVALDIAALGSLPGAGANDALAARIDTVVSQLATARGSISGT